MLSEILQYTMPYWVLRVLCRVGLHNLSCPGRQACKDAIGDGERYWR